MNLETGWTKPMDDATAAAVAMIDRAYRDAMHAIARDIPDPVEYARYLPLNFAVALVTSYMSQGGWRVADEYVAMLRPFGLVEYGGAFLTVFGMDVRRALKAEDA